MDASSWAQPYYLPEEQHPPPEGERRKRATVSATRRVTTGLASRKTSNGSRYVYIGCDSEMLDSSVPDPFPDSPTY